MTTLEEAGIVLKQFDATLVATMRHNLKERSEIPSAINTVAQKIPPEYTTGPAFCIFNFISDMEEGFDVEVGFPVSQPVEGDGIKTWTLPGLAVLSIIHDGPVEQLRETYGRLYGYTAEHALITDEFSREVYLDWQNPGGNRVELHYILHNWDGLLEQNMNRVLGQAVSEDILQGHSAITVESMSDERFAWVKDVMERLDVLVAGEAQKYDIVSGCAHIFPAQHIERGRVVYETARAGGAGALQAVDAVLEFMDADPVWGSAPRREGQILYSSKLPRDPKAYEAAQTDAERRSAYCFCPLVRNKLEAGMPVTFCYCGSGWFRRQWEGILSKPVRIEIVSSVLQGDDVCQFAIHLPDDL